MIALSCGIKISAVHHLHVSQSKRVTDRQMDGQTDRIMTPKTALAYTCVVKSKSVSEECAKCVKNTPVDFFSPPFSLGAKCLCTKYG